MIDYHLEAVREKVAILMEGDDLSFIFEEIKKKIALEIVNTLPEEVDRRNEKYQLVRGIKALEQQLQGYVNDVTRNKERT